MKQLLTLKYIFTDLKEGNHFRFLGLLWISFLVNQSFSQDLTVLSQKTKNPIEGVVVVSDNSNESRQITDFEGRLSLTSYADSSLLIFTHDNFQVRKLPVYFLKSVKNIYLMESFLDTVGIIAPFRQTIAEDANGQQAMNISSLDVERFEPNTSADMLQQSGQIFVQKTQGGGGSPVLRGFEANRVLLVIDGVRMNNAIYRSGHLQSAITVDKDVLDRTEVVFGPGSTIYGSDAIGGVVHFHTITPQFSEREKPYFTTNLRTFYRSADQSTGGHFNFNLGFKNVSWVSAVTYNNYGDIRMGQNRSHGDSTWGLRPTYQQTINGYDSVFVNPNPYVQVGTGYSQWDVLQKLRIRVNQQLEFTLNGQFSQSSNIGRYDKLIEERNGTLRYAQWDYGPQVRGLASFTMAFTPINPSWFNKMNMIVAYQKYKESRISRQLNDQWQENQEEDVDVVSLNADFIKRFSADKEVYYGAEVVYNNVQSSAFSQNIYTDEVGYHNTRYPNGGSDYTSFGIYAAYRDQIKQFLSFEAGARYSHFIANSVFTDTNLIQLPEENIKNNYGAISGNASLVWTPKDKWRISGVISSGFRAPNVDDYGKVFEKAGYVVVPNPNLTAEYAVNIEFGVEKYFWEKRISIGAVAYINNLFNTIVQQDYVINGNDSLLYDGEMAKVQAMQNAEQAYVYGTSLNLSFKPIEGLEIYGTYNFQVGKVIEQNVPMAHIPPMFGRGGVRYQMKGWDMETFVFYNGQKKWDDYAPGGTDNPDQAIDGYGTPAWWTLNARVGVWLGNAIRLSLAVENILDLHYKQFASAISAPGRSFNFSLKYRF